MPYLTHYTSHVRRWFHAPTIHSLTNNRVASAAVRPSLGLLELAQKYPFAFQVLYSLCFIQYQP